MPCQVYDPPRYGYTSHESCDKSLAALDAKWKKINDKLTLENDILRDVILGIAETNPELIPPKVFKKVEADQIKHRKEDLARLEKTFRASKDAERLGKVILADPKKPLEPQLGFNPDDF